MRKYFLVNQQNLLRFGTETQRRGKHEVKHDVSTFCRDNSGSTFDLILTNGSCSAELALCWSWALGNLMALNSKTRFYRCFFKPMMSLRPIPPYLCLYAFVCGVSGIQVLIAPENVILDSSSSERMQMICFIGFAFQKPRNTYSGEPVRLSSPRKSRIISVSSRI